MDGNLWRGAIVAGAFLAAVVSIVGAAGRGQTTENSHEDACESAVWPRIPATCFSGERAPYARPGHSMIDAGESTVFVDGTSSPGSGAVSGKADLLRAPNSSVSYRTVETRGEGVSVLNRVEIGPRDRAQ
jgi:hypothetical protein